MSQSNRRVVVACDDCNVQFLKYHHSLKTWKGRCRSCAQKVAKADPILRARLSKLAQAQVLRQGGIPNARRFQRVAPEAHPHWKGGKPKCPECGHTLSYKSRRCQPCFHKLLCGPNHPRWKGGITEENHRIRTSREYRDWRMAVFQRDRFTCVECGYRSCYNRTSKKCDIRADHIKPFSLFPELRFDLDNGRTLCIPCDKIHGWHHNRERGKVNSRTLQSHATTFRHTPK